MNTVRSTAYGWGALIFAAGWGYYFARKDRNERIRGQEKQGLRGPAKDWREKIAESETTTTTDAPSSSTTGPLNMTSTSSSSPSLKAPPDPKAS